MTDVLLKATAHESLLREAIRGRLTEDDALLWMVLLHTYAIHLRPGSMNGIAGTSADQAIILPPLTQRGAAAVIASLWRQKKRRKKSESGPPRDNYIYWYWQYNTRTPYEVAEAVPETSLARLTELAEQLAQDPRVLAVIPED